MKILLVQPPMPNMVMAFSPSFMHENVGKQPPMGLLNIATYLKQNSHHEVKILDCVLEEYDHQSFEREVGSERPDVVGISTTTMSFYDAYKAAEAVKKVLPETVVVLGGPHSSVYPRETIQHEAIDYLVEGEGDFVFTKFVDALEAGGSLENIPGLYFIKNGQVIYTGKNPFIQNLDTLPSPDRTLTSFQRYYSVLSKRRPASNMMTSRGCPFKCIYCNRMGKTFRTRSVRNVLAEIRECLDLGIQDITMYDDTFSLNRQRVVDICQGILNEEWDFVWNIRTRVDCVDEELLRLLKESGCVRVHYGIEAGNSKILKVLRKNIKIEDVKRAFHLTRKAGMETYAYLMIGSPEETEAEIEDTIRLVKQIGPDYAAFAITTPMPNTELYKMAFKENLYEKDHWLEYIRNPTPTFEPKIWDKEINQKRLQDLQVKAYKRFYGHPLRLVKRATSVRSFKEFALKSRIAIQMFFTR